METSSNVEVTPPQELGEGGSGIVYAVVAVMIFTVIIKNIGKIICSGGFLIVIIIAVYLGITAFKNLDKNNSEIIINEIGKEDCDRVFVIGDNVFKTVSGVVADKKEKTINELKKIK